MCALGEPARIIGNLKLLFMAKSTLEDLLLYMYNESNPSQNTRIEKELKDNWTVREKYNVLKESFERLSQMTLQSPRQQTIESILRYACCTPEVSMQ
jgi:hypothetical protein